MKNKESVAVIMSVYGETVDVLRLALDSILNQTFKDFRLIIVIDNPDNDEVINFLTKRANREKRISLVKNDTNMGLPFSLNRGIEMAKNSKYIARMDADDISVPTRLEEQYKYLEKHPGVDLIGCGVYYIDKNGKRCGKRNIGPSDERQFREAMSLVNIMSHPTFFGKTEVFKSNKYRDLKYTQDYDFICRLLEKGVRIININKYLLYYRKDGEKKNLDKATIQFVTQFFVQKYYSRRELNKTDISRVILEFIEGKKKYNKTKKAIGHYDKSIDLFKKKRIATGLFYMIIAAIQSKYCMDRVYKTIKYVILCKKWQNGDKVLTKENNK